MKALHELAELQSIKSSFLQLSQKARAYPGKAVGGTVLPSTEEKI